MAFRIVPPRRSSVLTALVVALAACGGGNNANTSTNDTATAAAPNTAAAGAGALPTPTPGALPAGATTAMVAEGDSIFHGLKAGGLCQTCHMPDATGGPLAPNLTDSQWLTGDGSYAFIQKRVTEGMPNPTPPYPGAMLPMGGAQLTPDQIKAVAAYVYSISHKA
jgi:mono/diheme cytochrome c family protein